MSWTNRQTKKLHMALQEAFPRREDLARMVRFGLNVRLADVAGGETLQDLVFSLIEWADAQEKLEDLYTAACQANPNNQELRELAAEVASHPKSTRLRLFLSYLRNGKQDEAAQVAADALGKEHEVFFDEAVSTDTAWAARVSAKLSQADVVIPFLTAQAAHNELLIEQIYQATQSSRAGGRPNIIPVRVAYTEPFSYPLNIYLADRPAAVWRNNGDTSRLIADLQEVLRTGQLPPQPSLPSPAPGPPLPPPSPFAQPPGISESHLERPDGTMQAHSVFYIERQADRVAQATIRCPGVTMTIKGPRQMGKSSLLIRVMRTAGDVGKHVAFLDFQQFDQADMADLSTFLQQFCAMVTDRLKLEDRVAEFWARRGSNIRRCSRYMEEHILPAVDGSLLLAMDEVDRVFDTEFRTDFFGMLRGWHNERAALEIWQQVDLALVTSTEPYQLIENLNQSPFNVGENLDLEDFTRAQVADLNGRHNGPLRHDEELRLVDLLSGQPYLTRRALYLVASGRVTASDLFATATKDRGPFGDHLRYHLFRLHDKPALVAALQSVLQGKPVMDELLFFRLRGAGLVKREGAAVVPRCQLYADYFRDHLNV
ncbi:MAG TPA: AAA-like domain-containing protein [Chloroflexia bacterium]|nr:AAA-like domain-containing protein [Chloroflexia bacterium]